MSAAHSLHVHASVLGSIHAGVHAAVGGERVTLLMFLCSLTFLMCLLVCISCKELHAHASLTVSARAIISRIRVEHCVFPIAAWTDSACDAEPNLSHGEEPSSAESPADLRLSGSSDSVERPQAISVQGSGTLITNELLDHLSGHDMCSELMVLVVFRWAIPPLPALTSILCFVFQARVPVQSAGRQPRQP